MRNVWLRLLLLLTLAAPVFAQAPRTVPRSAPDCSALSCNAGMYGTSCVQHTDFVRYVCGVNGWEIARVFDDALPPHLDNPSFEVYTTSPGVPDDWVGLGTNLGTFTRSADAARGSNSLSIARTGAGDMGIEQRNRTFLPGARYIVRLWAKSDTAISPGFSVRVKNVTAGLVADSTSAWAVGDARRLMSWDTTTAWRVYAASFEVPAGTAASDLFYVSVFSEGAVGRTVLFDDVELIGPLGGASSIDSSLASIGVPKRGEPTDPLSYVDLRSFDTQRPIGFRIHVDTDNVHGLRPLELLIESNFTDNTHARTVYATYAKHNVTAVGTQDKTTLGGFHAWNNPDNASPVTLLGTRFFDSHPVTTSNMLFAGTADNYVARGYLGTGGALPTWRGFYAAPFDAIGGSITNRYGLEVSDMAQGGATTAYPIWIRTQTGAGTNLKFEGGNWNTGHLEMGPGHVYWDYTNSVFRWVGTDPTGETVGRRIDDALTLDGTAASAFATLANAQTFTGEKTFAHGTGLRFNHNLGAPYYFIGSTVSGILDFDTLGSGGTFRIGNPTAGGDIHLNGDLFWNVPPTTVTNQPASVQWMFRESDGTLGRFQATLATVTGTTPALDQNACWAGANTLKACGAAGGVSGSGTAGRIPYWTGTTALGDSPLHRNAAHQVLLNTTTALNTNSVFEAQAHSNGDPTVYLRSADNTGRFLLYGQDNGDWVFSFDDSNSAANAVYFRDGGGYQGFGIDLAKRNVGIGHGADLSHNFATVVRASSSLGGVSVYGSAQTDLLRNRFYDTASGRIWHMEMRPAADTQGYWISGYNGSTWGTQLKLNMDGSLLLPMLGTATTANTLYFDTTTGRVTYGAAPSGSGADADIYRATGIDWDKNGTDDLTGTASSLTIGGVSGVVEAQDNLDLTANGDGDGTGNIRFMRGSTPTCVGQILPSGELDTDCDGTANMGPRTASSVLVGNGSGSAEVVIPDCDNATTSKLLFDQTTRTFSCGIDQTGGGSGAEPWEEQIIFTDFTTGASTSRSASISDCERYQFNVSGASLSCAQDQDGDSTAETVGATEGRAGVGRMASLTADGDYAVYALASIDSTVASSGRFSVRNQTRQRTRVRNSTNNSNDKQMAFGCVNVTSLNDESTINHGVYFQCHPSADMDGDSTAGDNAEDDNWFAVTTAGGTSTKTDTGVDCESVSYQILDIQYDGTAFDFFINGTEVVANQSTNIPTLNTSLCGALYATGTGAGGSNEFRVDYIYLKTDGGTR